MARSISISISIVFALVAPAAAEPVVLAIDPPRIYVELGARDGVGAGTQLELLHVVTVRDPRTGQVLRDQFALGTLEVIKSGDKISVASAGSQLARRVLVGDRVRVTSGLRKFADPWQRQVLASRARDVPDEPPPPPGAKPIDHAALVRTAWQDTLGKRPEQRIARWLAYLELDPHGPYRAAVQQEIHSLEGQIAARDAALAKARSLRPDDRAPRIARLAAALGYDRDVPLEVAPIDHAVPGRPIQLDFLVRAPGAFDKAWLYVKAPGAAGFRRTALVADGDAYLRGTIDAAAVAGPTVAWYVEIAGATGAPTPVLGSRDRPRVIAVDEDVVEEPVEQNRSHVDLHVDYVDFDGKLAKGFDQYYQAEADFAYRFGKPVYAVRLGFGTLSGTGGPKDVIDADPADRCLDDTGTYRCRNVSFSYVYTELEFRLRHNVALMLRPQAGLLTTDEMADQPGDRCNGRDIAGCTFFTGVGFRARLRLGEEAGTNLVLGAGFTQDIGTLLEAAYHWLPAKHLPVQLTVQVTDMPVPEDFGVRLIGDIGYRSTAWIYPSLRLSYQARDIDHAGVSGGLALNFDW